MRHPWPAAASAALFATGFGLLSWLGLSLALLTPNANLPALYAIQMWSLLLALLALAVSAAIAISFTPNAGGLRELLATPTRWHARRNALTAIATLLACAIGALLVWVAPGTTRTALLTFGGTLLTLATLGAISADALTHASEDVHRGVHPLLVPIRLLTGLQVGLSVMFALMATLLVVGRDGGSMFSILLALGVLLVLASGLYWRDTQAAYAAGAAGSMRPGRLRAGVCFLVAVVPLLAVVLSVTGVGSPAVWLWIVAVAGFAGGIAERRLFLAERRPDPTLG